MMMTTKTGRALLVALAATLIMALPGAAIDTADDPASNTPTTAFGVP